MARGAVPLSAGILVFDGVEVLDFAGPFEVLSRARLEPGVASRRTDDSAPFRVLTVGRRAGPVTAVGGLVVHAARGFDDAPPLDLVVVPGGLGTRALLEDEEVLEWVRSTAARARGTASVCTGALVLARAGLLRDRSATTHWSALDLLAELDGTIRVRRDLRWVRDGAVTTSAGVTAGIDMALGLVALHCGEAVADETARYIEYAGDWRRRS